MPYFSTLYTIPGGGVYASIVEADSKIQLAQILEKRQLGEQPVYYPAQEEQFVLLNNIREEKWAEALHEATFLCFVGLKSRTLNVFETLGDHGLVHEIAHFLDPRVNDTGPQGRQNQKMRIYDLARDFIKRVPGWPSNQTDSDLTETNKLPISKSKPGKPEKKRKT